MTKQQASWARRHDWCVAAYRKGDEYEVLCLDIYTLNGKSFTRVVTFYDYKVLRVWAGY